MSYFGDFDLEDLEDLDDYHRSDNNSEIIDDLVRFDNDLEDHFIELDDSDDTYDSKIMENYMNYINGNIYELQNSSTNEFTDDFLFKCLIDILQGAFMDGTEKKKVVKKKAFIDGTEKKKVIKKKVKKRSKHFENGVNYNWYYSKTLNDRMNKFYEKYARQPELKFANEVSQSIISTLYRKLKDSELVQEVQYVGSSYEGLRVGRNIENELDDLEYDIMFIMSKGLVKKRIIPNVKSHVYLIPADDKAKFKLADVLDGDYISPLKLAIKFKREIDKCFQCISEENKENVMCPELEYIKEISVLKNHGPAIQLDIYKNVLDHVRNTNGVNEVDGYNILNEDGSSNMQENGTVLNSAEIEENKELSMIEKQSTMEIICASKDTGTIENNKFIDNNTNISNGFKRIILPKKKKVPTATLR